MVKDTKFESKSQQPRIRHLCLLYCFYWSKIQNLKANHNRYWEFLTFWIIAFIGQRYKIWKQITTAMVCGCSSVLLLLLVKDTKFESKSQLVSITDYKVNNCFYWSKIQNLKANHNIFQALYPLLLIAFIGQRYKIWKQITT